MNRYLLNALLNMLPVSRFYRAKRLLGSLSKVWLGVGCRLNGNVRFYGHGDVLIGENTWIGPGCRFYTHPTARIEIGANCDIAPEVAFIVGTHEIGDGNRRAGRGYCLPIVVEDGCWIGARTTILAGVRIGQGSVIAAGSVVIDDIPANTLVAGVPARVKRRLEALC